MHEMLPSCNCRRTVWTGPGSSGERPFPLQSYVKLGPIRKVEREAQAYLSGPRGPLLQSWTAVAVERRGSSGRAPLWSLCCGGGAGVSTGAAPGA